jgi:hypothetical protein
MFINSYYFVGEINIPNAFQNANAIDQAITQYEKEILIQLLGYKLYSLLIADCTNDNPATQIYKDLVDGAEFVLPGSDITVKWEGLRNEAKQSLIAYYLSGTGVIMTPNGQGVRASSANKMCSAWERMRELYGIIPPNFRPYFRYPTKGGNIPCTFNSYHSNHEAHYAPSAFNFLYANKANYPDWVFTPQWNINAFGI